MSLDLKALITELESGEVKTMPPVMAWQPERIGEIDIRIDNAGEWFHEGGRFERKALVKLLSSILRKDDGNYYLVTPAEKLKIQVEDVPFVVIACHIPEDANEEICLFTQAEDSIYLNKETDWELRNFSSGQEIIELPYIRVRDDLFARLDRNVYYQLIEHALSDPITDEHGRLLLNSSGNLFPLGNTE